jgi:hypothetical protein
MARPPIAEADLIHRPFLMLAMVVPPWGRHPSSPNRARNLGRAAAAVTLRPTGRSTPALTKIVAPKASGADSMNNEVARVQIRNLDTRQNYAVVIAEIDQDIVAAVCRLEQRLGLARLRLGQK